MAKVAAAAAERHMLDSQERQRRRPATTRATCPDRQFSHMVPGTSAVGFGACPPPFILSVLGTPWLLPSSAQSLALLGPGISHCNDHKVSPSLEKDIFMSAPHITYFLDRAKKKSSTISSWPLKRETGDFHRQRRNLFCKYLFLLEGYFQ